VHAQIRHASRRRRSRHKSLRSEGLAWTSTELAMNGGEQIHDDPVVPSCGRGQHHDLAIHEFIAAFVRRRPGEELIGAHSALRSSGTSPNFRITWASPKSPAISELSPLLDA